MTGLQCDRFMTINPYDFATNLHESFFSSFFFLIKLPQTVYN